ncbi:hypothetical protein [Paracoccus ravus]|uniref:hypothetical protein n=1 Tax=Paracoccus ravus TaxID=2447760 RepID=UPI00106E791F|nr:hypothetical protein [Paracoccus ravus]
MTPHVRLTCLATLLALALGTLMLGQNLTAETSGARSKMTAEATDAPQPGVGERIEAAHLHRISRPGLYGISQPPSGSDYGVIDGKLVRFDPESLELQSVIRDVDRILD